MTNPEFIGSGLPLVTQLTLLAALHLAALLGSLLAMAIGVLVHR